MKTPSLFTNKGTPVRLTLTFDNGDVVLIHPLKHSASGLILKPEAAIQLGLNSDFANDLFYLINSEGDKVASFETISALSNIESFVVYPDGSTWRGRILIGKESQVAAMIWSIDLAQVVKEERIVEAFIEADWTRVPTIVSLIEGIQVGDCTRISHTCNDCDRASKLREIE